MSELQIFRCERCATAWFPERLCCPTCGGANLDPIPAGEGVVEEATTLPRKDATLGSVRLAAGPVVIARLDSDVAAGASVRLHSATDNAIWARRP